MNIGKHHLVRSRCFLSQSSSRRPSPHFESQNQSGDSLGEASNLNSWKLGALPRRLWGGLGQLSGSSVGFQKKRVQGCGWDTSWAYFGHMWQLGVIFSYSLNSRLCRQAAGRGCMFAAWLKANHRMRSKSLNPMSPGLIGVSSSKSKLVSVWAGRLAKNAVETKTDMVGRLATMNTKT